MLYRKRYIPNETIHLKNDEILEIDRSAGLIITRWSTLKPRKDFACGASCYYINKNVKVSKFLRADLSLLYYYCDIIKTDYDAATDSYTFCDLLIDVIIYPDGFVKVMDAGEISEAVRSNLITTDDALLALDTLDILLSDIYAGNFNNWKASVDKVSFDNSSCEKETVRRALS